MMAELGEELLKLALSSGMVSILVFWLCLLVTSLKHFFFLIVLPYLPFLSVCDSLLLYLIAVFFQPHLTLLMLLS